MRRFIYGSSLALIMLGAPGAPANGAWAEDQVFLTLEEISQTIIGNTMTGRTKDGDSYAEYYAPDGTIHGRSEKGAPTRTAGGCARKTT